jgi:hypothetical protein
VTEDEIRTDIRNICDALYIKEKLEVETVKRRETKIGGEEM